MRTQPLTRQRQRRTLPPLIADGPAPRHTPAVPLILALFASGFAGLLYETLWTRYLGLLLGHAAWAQTLVLALYMGGMAIGAGLAGPIAARVRRLFLAFAVVEGLLGLAAVGFHPVFLAADALAFSTVLPTLGVTGLWLVAASLVLPSAILLGTTWPLVATAAVRRGAGPGALAWTYFANTLGAAVGALACGPLVATLDLPGALAAAGVVDLCVAAFVVFVHGADASDVPTPPRGPRPGLHPLYLAALLTGLASFAYEVAWTRMLAMVLGSSPRAFELMLGAFLLGLALGGFAVRRRVTTEPARWLALAQLVMGLCALGSLVAYGFAFDAMQALLAAVERTPAGWLAYTVGTEGIALSLMLPATICAGTTMPLLCAAVLEDGQGEAGIGRVWAANTVGSIAGVLLAVHVGLPMLGLAGLVAAAAAIDMAVGVALVPTRRAFWVSLTSFSVIAVLVAVPLSPLRMASGVYRTGELLDPATTDVVFAADGRTASVAVTREGPLKSLRTNGKPDAGLRADDTPAFDESTMVLLGAIPLALHPDAKTAANVGLGSGLTSHTLLGAPGLERVDTVEIEPAMVAGARMFGDRVARTFEDPRSVLHLADARTFFASRMERYDLIVSEPSNPWVSGVAGLFSREFYHRSRRWLAPGGLLVQWLQAYEIDERLLASVLGAVSESYPDWEIWAANGGDLVVVASGDGPVPEPDPSVLDVLAPDLARVGIRTPEDLLLRRIGGRRALEPLLAATGAPANSDYAPLLELEAPKTLFLGTAVPDLTGGVLDALPVVAMLDGRADGHPEPPTWTMDMPRVPHRAFGRTLARFQQTGEWVWDHPEDPLPAEARAFAEKARAALRCETEPVSDWVDGMFSSFALRTLPHLSRAEAHALLDPVRDCSLEPIQQDFVRLLRAITDQDAPAMSESARAVLGRVAWGDPGFLGWVLGAAMLGDVTQGHRDDARQIWETESARLDDDTRNNVLLRLLRAHAEGRAFP